jgi:hypothetical protein
MQHTSPRDTRAWTVQVSGRDNAVLGIARRRLISLSLVIACSLGTPVAHSQDLSAASALSVLPLASVVAVGASAVVAVPVALATSGAVLVVKTVESTARGTVYVLERASDGARASVEIAGRVALASGTALVVTVVGAGLVLSAAGEAIAMIPNALGQALLHVERLTR